MAEDEQFSLCWNNFNTNLSAGFHESLCRGDLVDVTLAAEGQLVKAHRLVLSVCSPYFRKMFTQMPANQHAFVFLKDVSHAALKDLITFMYCGEVNVKQDALPAFISTAEALQIKGLTETGDSVSQPQTHTATVVTTATAPAKESSTTTTRLTTVPVQAPSTSHAAVKRIITKPRNPVVAQYKIESADDSADDGKHSAAGVPQLTTVPQTVKRVQKTTIPQSAPAAKRIKVATSTATNDPLENVESTQLTIQSEKDDEYITLPIESLNPKNEPDYEGTSVTEVEAQDQDTATYVEDETYGEMSKYDESYFTETDETGKPQQSFGESYSATEQEQSGTETQGFTVPPLFQVASITTNTEFVGVPIQINEQWFDGQIHYVRSQKKAMQLVYMGFIYNRKITQINGHTMWRCSDVSRTKCRATITTKNGKKIRSRNVHNHADHRAKLLRRPLYEEDLDEFVEIKPTHSKICDMIGVIDVGTDFKLVVHNPQK